MNNGKLVLYLQLAITVLGLLIISQFSWELLSLSFQDYTNILDKKFNQPDILSSINSPNSALTFFWFLRFSTLVLVVLLIADLYYLLEYKRALFRIIPLVVYESFANSIRANTVLFLNLSTAVRYSLGGLFFLQIFGLSYLASVLPYHYDEIYTYLYFSGNGLLRSLTFYPVPNNHVLHNVLSCLTLNLPIDIVFAIRLVSIIAAVLSSLFFFQIVQKNIDRHSCCVDELLIYLFFSYRILCCAGQRL